jgi:hypothetical protein
MIWVLRFGMCVSLKAMNMNLTISVAPETTDHGDRRLVCQPLQWSSYDTSCFWCCIAYAENFRSPPGCSCNGFAWIAAMALFTPFTSLVQRPRRLLQLSTSNSQNPPFIKAARQVVQYVMSWRCVTKNQNSALVKTRRVELPCQVANNLADGQNVEHLTCPDDGKLKASLLSFGISR